MNIRSHLLLLAAGAMLPVLAFAVMLSIVLVEQDNATVSRGALDRARAMMTGVDAVLGGAITTVNALSASSSLAAGDLATFHAETQRVLATQPTWTSVTLRGAAGEKLLDASVPYGAPMPAGRDPQSVATAMQTKQPAIGAIASGGSGDPGVAIRVPIVRGDAVVYVLSAIVRPDSFADLIRKQRLPDGWISGIVDSTGRFVARIPFRPAGELASVPFRDAVQGAPEGWYRGLTVDGKDTYTAHIRSAFSGWAIGLAIPSEIVLAGVRKTRWFIGIGVLASIAVAAGVVALSGRRIARPISALAAVARSIGTGDARPPVVGAGVEEVTAVAAALRDADVAVRERQSLIQREKDALQAADRAKDEFIAALSHELRNPLAALTAASHILRNAGPARPAVTDAHSVIERQTRHMSRMIEDLLDVSRIIMGKANLVFEQLDLGQLATTIVSAWRDAGRFADRAVDVSAATAWVCADRTRMEQVIANLLDNAVKFTPARSRIRVVVAVDGVFATLAVTDEGPGLSPQLMARAFDVFVQGEQGVGRAKGGIGVGLTLVKRLAELQGGTVAVASEGPGKGATFSVRLPAVEGGAPVPDLPAAEPRRADGCRILLVEDNADARAMLRRVLEIGTHDVTEAADGMTAVALANRWVFDVAIIDIGLPDIDGCEVARRIRSGRNAHATLIAVTGYGQPEDRERALEAGFDLHLVKPVTPERLEDAIAMRSTRPRLARPLAG
jgi:signal transduction histidine kinase/ActR/RegA family two-component response regulator